MIGSSPTGDHGISPLMSVNPLAPAFLPQIQSSCDPANSLGNSITMSFRLAQLFCGMSPQTIPPHAPSFHLHITDGMFLLPSLQLTSLSKPNAAVHQSFPEFSVLLSSLLLHQAKCLQSIHKTIQQFNQNLKAENLDRQARHCNSLRFNCKMTLPYYVICSSPIRILPLQTLLPNP